MALRITALGLSVKCLPEYLELVLFAAPCCLIGIPMLFHFVFISAWPDGVTELETTSQATLVKSRQKEQRR